MNRLDRIYNSLSAADLAELLSRRLDSDAADRRELAEALAQTGLGESSRLFDLAEHVKWFEDKLDQPPTPQSPSAGR